MNKKTKGIIIVVLAIIAYPIPGVPSTILIIIGAKMIKDYSQKRSKTNNDQNLNHQENHIPQ